MKSLSRLVGERGLAASQAGVTLMELAVVAAIIAVLSGLVVVSVAGTGRGSRTTAKGADIDAVRKAVLHYTSQHLRNNYPTLDGCLPGQSFNLITKLCDAAIDPGPFDVTIPSTYTAVIWDKAFQPAAGIVKRFVPDFLPHVPRHGFEHSDGTSWPQVQVTDPGGVVLSGLRVPQSNGVPAWVLDRGGLVHVTVPDTRY